MYTLWQISSYNFTLLIFQDTLTGTSPANSCLKFWHFSEIFCIQHIMKKKYIKVNINFNG